MQRKGHNLSIAQTGGQLVASCECGRWRRTLTMYRGMSLPTVVAQLATRHERHLGRLRKPGVEASDDDLPTLPDDE